MLVPLLLACAVSGAEARPPVRLVSAVSADGIELRVVGSAEQAVEASYRLEVASGASGNNRSAQSGRALVGPGAEQQLLRLRLGNKAGDKWSARLVVTPASAASYEQVASFDDAPAAN